MYDNIYNDRYGLADSLLGNVVTVNGISLYDYNADLIEYTPIVASIDYNILKKIGKHTYTINSYKNGNNGIKLQFYVGGTTKQQAQINCNRVIQELQKGVVVLSIDDTEFEYVGVLSSTSIQDTNVPYYYLLEVTLIAVKRLPFVVYEKMPTLSDNTMVLYNEGIIESGAVIVIESNFTKDSVTITCNARPITINNFSEYKYHIIDGLNGKVLCGTSEPILNELVDDFSSYTNNFGNTDLVEFPYVVSGQNTVTIENADGVSNIALKYYPVFVI